VLLGWLLHRAPHGVTPGNLVIGPAGGVPTGARAAAGGAGGLVIGLGVLAVVLFAGLLRSAPAAVAGLAAYTVSRQFILGLRAEPRQWQYGRRVTAAAAAIAAITSAALLARG
jgi:hypothetical protein